ncbi:flagellar motor protein [Nitrincola tibetensis]|uniref:Flagellar motor protein n=1 Tax=Nitrincola tibetensis TaxID=2219697 RepID=A0A364NRB6_9GAMM|nr:OmpA family protein [Nitrincola tibetensis]RAU19659.1 flagellar motor protein [Nitrincola tibetensis]
MKSSRKQQLLEENDGPGWITTFADLMTLLLVFFVLLFSISSIEMESFEETARSISLALSREGSSNSLIELEVSAPDTSQIPEIDHPVINRSSEDSFLADQVRFQQALLEAANAELSEIATDLNTALNRSDMGSWVEIGTPRDGKLNLRVNGAIMFETGSANIRRSMMPVLDSVLEIALMNPGFKLEIQGHTDNTPINTEQFPSNWELSAVRATTVLRFLVEGGLAPIRVTATGYGDTLPLVPNDSELNQAMNRRIEFVLEKIELPKL